MTSPADKTCRFRTDKRVTFNVSGSKFITWESTLKRHPGTLLGSERIKHFFDNERKEYFFDRDPHMFRYILDFYRVGRLHLSFDDCVCSFRDELRFYGISIKELDSCCWEEYFECNKKSSQESIKSEPKPKRHLHTKQRTLCIRQRKWLWNVLENTDGTSTLGKVVQSCMGILIYISILLTIVETISCGSGKTCEQLYPRVFFGLEAFCISIFTIDYLLRLYASEDRTKFVLEKLNIVDVLAVLPFYVVLCVEHFTEASSEDLQEADTLMIMRIFRIFRILKLSRHSKHLRKLAIALRRAIVDLGFLFFAFGLANILFASVLYFVEKDKNEKFDSIPSSMWYTIITMMTVGFVRLCSLSVILVILSIRKKSTVETSVSDPESFASCHSYPISSPFLSSFLLLSPRHMQRSAQFIANSYSCGSSLFSASSHGRQSGVIKFLGFYFFFFL